MSASTSKTSYHVVHRNYQDHAHDVPTSSLPFVGGMEAITAHCMKTVCGSGAPFPIRLHELLDRVEVEGFANVISWQLHGRCFVIRDQAKFKELLPRYFPCKIASFQRQLNLYGFQRITQGTDKGAYYNPYFLRGMPFLTSHMHRIKVKGTGARQKSNPDQQPGFYSMEWVSGTVDVVGNRNCDQSSLICQTQQPQQLAPSVSSSSLESQANAVSKLNEWGMSFYALDSLPADIVRGDQRQQPSIDQPLAMGIVPNDVFLNQDYQQEDNGTLIDILDQVLAIL